MTTTTTVSGLQYEDKIVGEGAEAQAGNHVVVHYTGWLQNPDGSAGKKFDSSKDRNDPFSFPLGAGHVIKGWDEGVQGMKIGGTRILTIPSSLGYGPRGAGGADRLSRCQFGFRAGEQGPERNRATRKRVSAGLCQASPMWTPPAIPLIHSALAKVEQRNAERFCLVGEVVADA